MKICIFLLLALRLISCHNNRMKVEFERVKDKAEIRLITMRGTEIMYNSTTQKTNLPDIYGENDWYIVYRDSLCGRIRHFKTNRNDKHSYLFKFFESRKDIYCKILIEGESPVDSTLKLYNCRSLIH